MKLIPIALFAPLPRGYSLMLPNKVKSRSDNSDSDKPVQIKSKHKQKVSLFATRPFISPMPLQASASPAY